VVFFAEFADFTNTNMCLAVDRGCRMVEIKKNKDVVDLFRSEGFHGRDG
jgi:hypothetical protein